MPPEKVVHAHGDVSAAGGFWERRINRWVSKGLYKYAL